jgi:hypothetical protein
VCVDGEGQDFPDGTHRYVLLGVGEDQISDPNGLSWEQCFEFLYSRFESGGTAYTGFFLGYDFTQIFRSMPEYQARRLLDSKERAKRKRRVGHNNKPLEGEIYFPVDLDGWEFDILGNKRLKLRPAGQSRWMYICDTGGFFQKSFLSVINPAEWKEPVVSDEEYATIQAGKELRSTAILDDSMRHYNALENRVLGRVLGELDTGFRSLGVHLSPKQWFGPGQAAQAWLDTHKAITTRELQDIVPEWFLDAARYSYYGGWFEIMAHGHIPGESHEYDINSAYPYIISRLPCLRHGVYSRVPADSRQFPMPSAMDGSLHLVQAEVWASKSQEVPDNYNHHLGAMLHRDKDGNISRPLKTEGWYWLDELESARTASVVAGYKIRESITYAPCDCPPPFAEIQEIYDTRLRVGKKTPLGIASKLLMNSGYGKFAQSVGNPKYGNPIYASRITSECRRMILDAIATHPKGKSDVLMVATDGIYFRSEHETIQLSGNLGDWEHKVKANMCLFKPGVYWDDTARASIRAGKAPVFKARGVNAKYFGRAIAAVDDKFTQASMLRRVDVWPEVSFGVDFSMVTATQALARGKWETAGTVNHDVSVTQSSNPSSKRQAWYLDGDIIRSKPPKNIPYEPSHPYTKRFGLDDPWSDESTSQYGDTPDGKVADLWKEILAQ